MHENPYTSKPPKRLGNFVVAWLGINFDKATFSANQHWFLLTEKIQLKYAFEWFGEGKGFAEEKFWPIEFKSYVDKKIKMI